MLPVDNQYGPWPMSGEFPHSSLYLVTSNLVFRDLLHAPFAGIIPTFSPGICPEDGTRHANGLHS